MMALFITPLIFVIELISNSIRPFTLGVRLFANMFSDEQVFVQILKSLSAMDALFGAADSDSVRSICGICSGVCVYAAVDDLHRRSFACTS